MKRWGLLGGTFDPIHFGHLNLAQSILEERGLDKVLFCLANYSPHKEDAKPLAPAEIRKKCVELAVQDYPDFSLCELELEREGPSYTIDTVEELIKLYPDVKFHLILGEDMLPNLTTWKDIEKLVKLAPPFVGARPTPHQIIAPEHLQPILEKGKTPVPTMDISSTSIRERFAKKKICNHLIPTKVLDFLIEKRLY